MTMSNLLQERSKGNCELCATIASVEYLVPPKKDDDVSSKIALCNTCHDIVEAGNKAEPNYLRFLNETIWSETPSIQVVSYRLLEAYKNIDWVTDLLDMAYLDEDTLKWAAQGPAKKLVHKDCNGNILSNGDTVTLIQDLNIKGSQLTGKRGTAVRRIRLVQDNEAHIEGKIDGQHIVILTKYVKKSS